MNNLFVSNLFNNQNRIIKEGLINRVFFNVGDTILSFENLQRRNRDLNKLLLDILSLTFTLNFSVDNSNYQNIYNSYYIKNNILYLYINPTYLPNLDFVGSTINSEGNSVKDFEEQNPKYTFTVTKYVDDAYSLPEPILIANKTFYEVNDSNAILTLTNTHPEYTYKWYKWNNQTNRYDELTGKTGEVLQYNLTNTSKIKVETYARNKTYTKIITLYKKSDAIQTGYYMIKDGYSQEILKYKNNIYYYTLTFDSSINTICYFHISNNGSDYSFDNSFDFYHFKLNDNADMCTYYSGNKISFDIYESLVLNQYLISTKQSKFLGFSNNTSLFNSLPNGNITNFAFEQVTDMGILRAPPALYITENKIIITHNIQSPGNGIFRIIDASNTSNSATYTLDKDIEITMNTSPISYNSPIELNFEILNSNGTPYTIKIYQNEVNPARLIRQQNDLTSLNFNPYKFIIEIQDIKKPNHKLEITSGSGAGAYSTVFDLGPISSSVSSFNFKLSPKKIEDITFKILDNNDNPVDHRNIVDNTLVVSTIRLYQANVDFHTLSPGYHNTHVATFENFDTSGHTVSSALMKFSHIV